MSCNIIESETLLVTVLKSVHSLYWLQCIIAIVKWFIAPLLLAFRSIKGKKYSPTTTRQYNRLYRFFCSIKQRCFLSWCFFLLWLIIVDGGISLHPTHKSASVTKNSVDWWTTSTGNVEGAIDIIQHWKIQKIWNPFHKENYLISKWFSNLSARAARLIFFARKNLAVLCVERPWNGLYFSCTFQCCMWSIFLAHDGLRRDPLRSCSRTKAVTRNGLYSQKNISPLFHTYIMKDCLTAYCAR